MPRLLALRSALVRRIDAQHSAPRHIAHRECRAFRVGQARNKSGPDFAESEPRGTHFTRGTDAVVRVPSSPTTKC